MQRKYASFFFATTENHFVRWLVNYCTLSVQKPFSGLWACYSDASTAAGHIPKYQLQQLRRVIKSLSVSDRQELLHLRRLL